MIISTRNLPNMSVSWTLSGLASLDDCDGEGKGSWIFGCRNVGTVGINAGAVPQGEQRV